MKILLIIASLEAGGKERQFVELLKGLSKQKDINYEVVIMNKKLYYKEIFNLNIRIHYLNENSENKVTTFYKLYCLCKNINPDIIHTWDNRTSIYIIPIAKILNIKILNGSIRGAFPNINKISKLWLLRRTFFIFSDITVANSYTGLKCYDIKSYKGVCIYNGFDFERLINIKHKEDIKLKYNIKTNKIVCMIASFKKTKNYKHYILAAKNILARREDVTFLAIGDGQTLAEHKKLIDRLDGFKFIGHQGDVESIINLCNVGVLMTNTQIAGEGISNTIMEYMSLGKPIIATDCGGTSELVLNNITGFLIQDNNVSELEKKIDILLDNDRIARDMGVAGHLRIKEEFNLEKMTSSYISLYNRRVAS